MLPREVVTPLASLVGELGDDNPGSQRRRSRHRTGRKGGVGWRVAHTPGVRLVEGLMPVPLGLVTDPETGEPGLHVRFLDEGGSAIAEENRRSGHMVWLGGDVVGASSVVEISGRITVDADGEWRLGMAGVGRMTLEVDGQQEVDETLTFDEDADPVAILTDPPQAAVTRQLKAGDTVDVVVRHLHRPGTQMLSLVVGVERPHPSADEGLAAAVALAGESDVAVVVVGTTEKLESEGVDRTNLQLPGRQDELVSAVARVNPRTVVVVNSGSPVEMPWQDEVAAILLVWFPGQEAGDALADVLLGDAEPGGRLPTTWPRTMDDVPVLSTTPVDGQLAYTEGTGVGYRAWRAAGVEPAYWFGHGLGYTTWAYDAVDTPGTITPETDVTVTVRVRNTGDRDGSEVIQAYLSTPEIDGPRLAAYARVSAPAGERVDVELSLPARAFQTWVDGAWQKRPGPFTLHVGPSVANTPLTATLRG